jgi:hypothetical protein
MWGNPRERERERFISFRKVHISNNNTFPAREIHLQHPKVPKFLPGKCAKKLYCCTDLPRNQHLENVPNNSCCTTICTALFTKKNTRKTASKIVPKLASILCPLPLVVWTVRIRTVRPLNKKSYSHSHRNSLGICAQSLLGNVPSLLP